MDMASVQAVTEEIVLRLVRDLSKTYDVENFVWLGMALNCS